MDIKKLFERESTRTTAQTSRQTQVNAYQQQAVNTSRNLQSDSVTISPLSRQLAQLSTIIADDEAGQRSKVDSIRERIKNGEYSASPEAVAGALISFAADSEGIPVV